MKVKLVIFFILLFKLSTIDAQTITDIDGNTYHAVSINNLLWFNENLKVTRYSNGDSITDITQENQIAYLTGGGYANYSDTIPNFSKYGKLYNYFAVKDSRGLCPKGWRVPFDREWTDLIFYQKHIAAILKIKDTSYWKKNFNDSIDLGFNALPSGYRTFYNKKIEVII